MFVHSRDQIHIHLDNNLISFLERQTVLNIVLLRF